MDFFLSFRGAPLGASPESILPIVVMDFRACAKRRIPEMTKKVEYFATLAMTKDGIPHGHKRH
jgi:hypothetical protein